MNASPRQEALNLCNTEPIGGNPFAVLTAIVAPAILTNAYSVLALGTSNRPGRPGRPHPGGPCRPDRNPTGPRTAGMDGAVGLVAAARPPAFEGLSAAWSWFRAAESDRFPIGYSAPHSIHSASGSPAVSRRALPSQ